MLFSSKSILMGGGGGGGGGGLQNLSIADNLLKQSDLAAIREGGS